MTLVRVAAARVLLAVEQGRTTLATEIDRAREGIDSPRDRALLIEIATGTLRWRAELDALIVLASRRAIPDIEPRARAVLRLGAYQLRHLQRIPAHAIVHESVEVIRALDAARAAGFVNAVMRTLVRRGETLTLPPRPGPGATDAARVAYLSTTLAHPDWLMKRWLKRYGFDATEQWCHFNNASPDVTVRSAGRVAPDALLDRMKDAGIQAEPARYVPGALRLSPGQLGRLPPDLRADVAVHDEGSQIVAWLVGARRGERVLDVCAAPGGKTTVLAASMAAGGDDPASLLVAADRRPGRIAVLRATLARAGLTVPIVTLDALEPLPFPALFDRVLLDVPCSGLGTLRRDPDLKWARREEDLGRLALDAGRMLARAADAVKPGGRLIYATCSSEPDENHDVVRAFLASDTRFHLVPAGADSALPADLFDARGYLVTHPARHGLDAFFAAVLVRRQGA